MIRKPTPEQIDARLRIASTEKPVRNSTSTEPYRGAELRSTNNRAGAQDAYRLPSRTFYGVRTPGEA
ncbi:hypothetical protein [Paracidovorax wautersii]|uniref:Uncharacterized protein n=1 Tax=Paracidovorax wautersii TaxID=1177982 RepID=A0A1I2GE12_9BURK|nr:hypothetical protein [Paracidovorax wautersii]SFF15147.1 hypothetical protein SAMN04489711_11492 [Paracidovorax wautersii]